MEDDEPTSPSLPGLDGYIQRLNQNHQEFEQYVDEVLEAVDQDANFIEMTSETYDEKKAYIKKHVVELSIVHGSLLDQFSYLIEQVSNNCPSLLQAEESESDSSLQDSQMPASTTTGFEILWNRGGYILSKSKVLSHTVAKSPDAVKLEETNKVLNEKISDLEEEVESLKQKVQILTVENGELKQEVEDNITDIRVYISETKLETKALEEELKASKEFAKRIDKHMCKLITEKVSEQTKHDAEISQLKSTNEKKEKIWNGLIEQFKKDLEEKYQLVEKLSKNLADLIIEKAEQNRVVQQLQTELNSLKFENVRVRPSVDQILKLTGEVKVKVAELEKEVSRKREAMSKRE